MGDIEEIYEDLEAEDVSLEEFRAAVEEKVAQMGGLADEETAAMLIAHELDDGQVNGVADIEPGMEEVSFTAKVTGIGELRTFERDDEDRPEGQVINVEVADETGQIRISFWDEMASAADSDLEVGQVLNISGRPRDGYNGVEVNVDQVEANPDADIEVSVQDEYRVSDLTLGVSDVTLVGEVLATEPVRTFDRDDGSEGQVSNVVVGDETGRVRVTLWDEKAPLADEYDPHDVVEVIDGYVRERDGNLELHVGDRGSVKRTDADVSYVPDATPIEAVEIDQTVDLAGVVRSADPKRTFDRDDGTEGQVRNVRIQDETGDIRVALWGEKADVDLGPGDEVLFVDVEIQDGWQDDLEASAGWGSTVIPLEDGLEADIEAGSGESDTGLSAFQDQAAGPSTADSSAETPSSSTIQDDTEETADGPSNADPSTETADSPSTPADADDSGAGSSAASPADRVPTVGEEGEYVEFTGVVVQAGTPVILDDGKRTVAVETGTDVELGQEITVSGRMRDGRLDAEDVV